MSCGIGAVVAAHGGLTCSARLLLLIYLWKLGPLSFNVYTRFCFLLSDKLTSATKEAVSFLGSPSLSPSSSVQGSRRGSISSMSSISSVLDEKDDERIRCCRHCMGTLHKREQQMDEKDYAPEIVKFYEVGSAWSWLPS